LDFGWEKGILGFCDLYVVTSELYTAKLMEDSYIYVRTRFLDIWRFTLYGTFKRGSFDLMHMCVYVYSDRFLFQPRDIIRVTSQHTYDAKNDGE